MGSNVSTSVQNQPFVQEAQAGNRKIPKALNGKQIRAIALLAQDRSTDEAIAKQVGVTPGTLWKWKREESFALALEHEMRVYARRVLGTGLGMRHKRFEGLQDLANRQRMVMQERGKFAAEDPEMAAVPGARTGMIVRTSRARTVRRHKCSQCGGTKHWPIGSKNPCSLCDGTGRIEEIEVDATYETDNALAESYKSTIRQISEEVGDLVQKTKTEISGPDGAPITVDVVSSVISEYFASVRDARRNEVVVEARAEPAALVGGEAISGDIG